MPARDHRRTAKKLAEAGRWPEAVQVAQETGALDNDLLLRAIAGLTDEVKISLHIVDDCSLAKGQSLLCTYQDLQTIVSGVVKSSSFHDSTAHKDNWVQRRE